MASGYKKDKNIKQSSTAQPSGGAGSAYRGSTGGSSVSSGSGQVLSYKQFVAARKRGTSLDELKQQAYGGGMGSAPSRQSGVLSYEEFAAARRRGVSLEELMQQAYGAPTGKDKSERKIEIGNRALRQSDMDRALGTPAAAMQRQTAAPAQRKTATAAMTPAAAPDPRRSIMAYDEKGNLNAWQTFLNLISDAKAFNEEKMASKTAEQRQAEAEARERFLRPKTAEEARQVYGLDYDLEAKTIFGKTVYVPKSDVSVREIHGLDESASSAEILSKIVSDARRQAETVGEKIKGVDQALKSGGRKTGNPVLDNWGETMRQNADAAKLIAQTYGLPTYALEGSLTRENTDAYLRNYSGKTFGGRALSTAAITPADYALSIMNAGLVAADTLSGGKFGKKNSVFQIANFLQNAGSGLTGQAIGTMRESSNWLGKLALDLEKTSVEMLIDRVLGGLTPMGVRTFGAGAQEAEDRGESLTQQVKTGAARAAVEVGTEMMSGVGGSWRGVGYGDSFLNSVDRWVASKTGSELLGTLTNAFSAEMIEEMAADILNPLMDRILGIGEATGRGEDRTFMESLGDFLTDVWGDGQILYDGLLGGLSGMGGGALTHVSYTQGAKNLAVDVATYKAAERIAGNSVLKGKFEKMTGVKLSTNEEDAKIQVAAYLTNVSDASSRAGNPVNAQQAEQNLSRGVKTGVEETAAKHAAKGLQTKQVAGILQSTFNSNDLNLTDTQAQEMADRYDPSGNVSMTDFVVGSKEAYKLGNNGMTLQQAIQSSEYASRMTPEQFNRAWAMGATVNSAVNETADVGTEDGQTRLAAGLEALGKHADEAAKVYEAGQDVSTFSAAMNKAAALYAANGMDLKSIVQDARDGKTADIVGRLTDTQVETAVKIGQQMRAEQQAEIQASASRFQTLRSQAAALVQKTTAALTDVNKALSEARKFGQQEQNAFKDGLAALEAMVKADPSIEGTEAYNKAYDELLEHRKNVEKMQKVVEDLEAKRKELQKQQSGKRKKGTVSFDGGTINGKTVKGVDRSSLNRQQKKAVALVEALADAVNIDYVLFDGDAKGAQGAYVQGGTVYVNVNAGMATGKSLAAATLSHELTHYLQDYAPEEYQALKDFIVSEVLGKTPGQFDALVRRQLRVEPDLSYDEAVDEVIANACQTMLQNSKAVTELARQNMTLAEKIADVIENISEKIKAAFEEVSTDELAFKNAVKAVEGELDRVQAMWDKALTAATENYNAEQSTRTAENENTAPEGGVKYQHITPENDSIRIQIQKSQPELDKMAAVAKVNVQATPKDVTKAVPWAVERLKHTGFKAERQGFGTIVFDETHIREALRHITNHPNEIGAILALPRVLKRGQIIEQHKKHQGRVQDSFTIAAPIEVNGVRGNMGVVVHRTTRNFFHAYRVLLPDGSNFTFEERNKKAASKRTGELSGNRTLIAESVDATDNTIAEVAEAVKENDAPAAAESTRFQMADEVEETDRFVAVHNKSVSGLRRMLQRGGVPFPSIAIKKAGAPHEGFGDVSIVFPRSSIDPEANRQNRLYSNDAWTPTEPRTEYEVADTWKLQQQMEKEIGREAYRATMLGSYIEKNQLEKDLASSEGDIVKALKGRTGIKYAYLKSIGKEPKAPTREKPLDGFGRYKNAQLLAVFEQIPAEELKAMNYDSAETLQKVADALNQQFLDTLPPEKQKAREAFSRHPIYSAEKINPQIIKDALRNYENSGGKMESEIDSVALEKSLRDNTALEADPEYQKWIRDRFGNLITDSGIPNGKGVYTDSGNRRSFKARHVPATLENIVKQMQKEQEKGIGLFGINLRGAATKSYSTVEEMRADRGKLLGTHIADEVYDSYMKEFGQRLNDLTETADKVGYDTAKETLLEAVRDSRSKADMKRRLQKESRFIRYSEELADELWQLRNDVQNMPAPYFEAKPRRIVYPDEALAYILPDNADSDVVQALQERGYNVLTYKAGDEQDRLAKLNSVEGARFQKWDEASEDERKANEIDAMIREAEDALEFEDDNNVIRSLNNRLTKLYAEKDKLVAKERRLSRKTSIDEIISNLSRYRYSDLESLAEQYSDGAWDIEPGTPREQLENELRDALEERAADMTPLQRQAPAMGLYVRPVGETKFQQWDDTTGDTAAESNGRELAYTRLQSENKILSDTVAALNKVVSKKENTIEKLQKQLHLTKTQEVRETDARKLARQLLKENGSRADVGSVAEQIKALGDYILQTPVNEVSEEEIKNRARSAAAEILESAAQQTSVEDETWTKISESLRGSKLTIEPEFFGELDGGFDAFRKSMFGKLTLAGAESQTIDRSQYTSVSQFYADMQSEYGTAYFPDAANEGEELMNIAKVFELTQPMEVNPFDQYMGEATEELANRIAMDAMSGVLRVNPPTFADQQKARRVEMQERIQQLRDEKKLDQREAARLYQTIYGLSVALDKAESKYTTLRKEADYRTAQVRAEGAARATEIKALERAKAAEQISALKTHYQEMQARARERRTNTGTRNKIRKMIADLNNRLKHPTENRHVPRELMQATLDVLTMIDLDTGRGSTKVAEKLADIRAMYDSYKNNPTYQIAYDETVAQALNEMETMIHGTRLVDMDDRQLTAVYNVLKSLTHVIDTAVKVKIGTEEHNAFELAKEMSTETSEIPKAQKGWMREHYLPAHLRADVAFRRFAGHKKGSTWEKAARMLNDGQLKQTRLKMELSRPFEKIFTDQKALADFTGVNWRGKIDQSKLVDIGLKDADGNAILLTHDLMVSIYMDLLNAENRKHFIRTGKTIPNLQDYYDGKGGWGDGSVRSQGIAERLSELDHSLAEAKRAGYGDWADQLQAEIDDLMSEGEQHAADVQRAIEKQLTDFDRQWVEASQQLMDVDSKRELNRTTMEVYGIEKASVPNYWPITSDPNYLSKPMETVVSDMSLENVGFMKERIGGANPTLALGTVQVVTRQIDRVAQYCGIMPAVRNFSKIWSKTEAGYATSLKEQVSKTFQRSGIDYIENLIADLQGANSQQADILGLDAVLGRARGNMAQATLTLNPRVALAQAASFPTAAAEVGWNNLGKALARGGKDGRVISQADQELIAKWSPLLWYRMQGYATPELGDIQSSNDPKSRLWRKLRWFTGWIQAVDGATVGRLWYAAEYWVQENKPTLEKGSDAYYEAVAEKFNAVVEKTQPNYTTMQRAAILRSHSSLIKTFTMFMTQRLQNMNIVYDATASYQKARADLAAGRNSVTKADVDEARHNLTLAVSSQLVQTAVFVGFKFLTDALLRNLKGYRDKDTGDLTEESVSAKLLDMYVESMIGSVLGGSEMYTLLKAMTGNGKWYGISISGVDTFNDTVESLVDLANTDKGLSDPESRQKLLQKVVDLGTNAATLFGIPAPNALKIGKALKWYALDAEAGKLGASEAGYNRTKKQWQTKEAVDAGVPKNLYKQTIKEANTNGGSLSQDELGPYLREETESGRITPQQAETIWSVQGWSKDYDEWKAGVEKKEAQQAALEAAVEKTSLTVEEYEQLLTAADANRNNSVTQDELGEYLTREISAGRLSRSQAEAVWATKGWKKTYGQWEKR